MGRKKRKKKLLDAARRAHAVLILKDQTILIETHAPHASIPKSQELSKFYHPDVHNLNRVVAHGCVQCDFNFQCEALDPPKNAQRLLSLVLRLDEREAAIGDL